MHRAHRGHAVVRNLIVAALIAAGAAWAMLHLSKPSVWLDDVDSAIALAKTEQKPVLVLFTADWCPPCRRMKRNALSDPEVMTELNDTFVLVKVDLTQPGGPNSAIATDHGVQSIPTMIVYDANGRHIDTATGPRTRDELLALATRNR